MRNADLPVSLAGVMVVLALLGLQPCSTMFETDQRIKTGNHKGTNLQWSEAVIRTAEAANNDVRIAATNQKGLPTQPMV